MTQAADFEAVLQAHLPLMDRIIRVHERNASVRLDIRQEAALALWRALPGFRGDASMKTFVARVTHNVCIDHVRREQRRRLPPNAAEELALAPETQNDDPRLERLLNAMPLLSEGHRHVISLYLEDFSHRDMADALGISEGAVAVRVNRAKEALRKVLASHVQP